MSGPGNALALCFLPQPGSAHRVPKARCKALRGLSQEEQGASHVFLTRNCRADTLISLSPGPELKAREEYMGEASQLRQELGLLHTWGWRARLRPEALQRRQLSGLGCVIVYSFPISRKWRQYNPQLSFSL